MRKFARSLAGLMIVVVLLGCRTLSTAFSSPTSAVKLPALTGDWHITLNQSGGFVGISRTLEISSGGEMSLTDLRSNKTSNARLPADRLSALTELVAASKYQAASASTGCADCFIFNLEISSGGEKFQVQLDQVNLANSGLQPLVDFLSEYLNSLGK